jgi:hypothetical protein
MYLDDVLGKVKTRFIIGFSTRLHVVTSWYDNMLDA